MRALVTGGHGFVGRWLRAHLEDAGDDVIAPSSVDVTDRAAVDRMMADHAPEVVYHLAARTHVGESWQDPDETFIVNALGTLHVVDAAAGQPVPPRVLVVSSAEVYGAVSPEDLPLREESPLRPMSPYAASKAAAEFIALQAHLGRGLPVVRIRAFNHVGPGQAPTFAIPAFARRIIEAIRKGEGTLRIGNPEPRRDFTDVRDVVRAYRMLAAAGAPGEVYNVCSGRDMAIGDVAKRMVELAGGTLDVVTDAAHSRSVDVPVLRGDPSRLQAATGWKPEIDIDDTLRAVLRDVE